MGFQITEGPSTPNKPTFSLLMLFSETLGPYQDWRDRCGESLWGLKWAIPAVAPAAFLQTIYPIHNLFDNQLFLQPYFFFKEQGESQLMCDEFIHQGLTHD